MEGKIETACIVDDDDIYQFTTSLEMKRAELVNKVILFPNGQKAINFFKLEIDNAANLPDVVFLDVNMPVMDGWQFLEEFILIKALLPKTIVIYMVSSSVDPRDMSRARKISELSGYIVKPIGKQQLKDVFATLLG